MFGRTRLYRQTGSPLIQGVSGRRRRAIWPWVVAVLVVAAAVTVWVLYLR